MSRRSVQLEAVADALGYAWDKDVSAYTKTRENFRVIVDLHDDGDIFAVETVDGEPVEAMRLHGLSTLAEVFNVAEMRLWRRHDLYLLTDPR